MDSNRFDSLSRLVAGGGSRRRIVGSLLVGLATPMFPQLAYRAAAACKKVNQNCDKNKDCCSHAHCPSNKCRCKNGFSNCNNECFDLDTDEQRCGSCTNACAAGERCCDGDCVDVDRDDANCGACGAACDTGEECVGGTCVVPPGGCAPGADECATSENFPCGGNFNCGCKQTTEGTTFCAGPPIAGSFCGNCDTSADCTEQFGPEAVCAASTSIEVCCGPDAQNACVLPCPVG